MVAHLEDQELGNIKDLELLLPVTPFAQRLIIGASVHIDLEQD